jgi:ribosomal protein S8
MVVKRGGILTSPLTDAMGRIDTAARCHKPCVSVPLATIVIRVLRLLEYYGAIANFIVRENDILVYPSYSAIRSSSSLIGIYCVTTRSRRITVTYKNLKRFAFMHPHCNIILSTRQGISTFDLLYRRGLRPSGELLAIFET